MLPGRGELLRIGALIPLGESQGDGGEDRGVSAMPRANINGDKVMGLKAAASRGPRGLCGVGFVLSGPTHTV